MKEWVVEPSLVRDEVVKIVNPHSSVARRVIVCWHWDYAVTDA